MCGIAGWLTPAPHPPDAHARLHAMIAAIRHRGPDGEAVQLHPHAALGHTRLAIIDLAGGTQPMTGHGASLVFNGEIYNYRELRGQLKRAGHRFRTDSDTEVILALYGAGSWPAFAKLRGMYAFALWDARRRTGYLVRDPLGIKPLFLAETPAGLLFGSEAKALLAHGAFRAELDPPALHLLMNFRYLPGGRSMFAGVRQLAAGTVLEWTPAGTRAHQLPEYTEPVLPLDAALADSVSKHMTADVEVGAYLSGGIDSAAIAAIARRHGLRRTFTLAVGDDANESRNAAETASLLGLENRCGVPGEDCAHRLIRLIRALEVPKVNALQVSQLAALASGKVKVVLSGLGGDELFYGYNAHRILHRAAGLAHFSPRWANAVLGEHAAALLRRASKAPWGEPERAAQMLANLGDWPRVYGLLRNLWDTPEMRRRIYGPRLLDAPLPNAFDEIATNWPADPDPVVSMACYEWREKMVNDLLWQEDRASMAEGLEVRVPFVDRALAAAARAHARTELMPGGKPKGRLREILRPLIPAEVLARRKSGFQVDSPSFFRQHLGSLASVHLSVDEIRRHGLFNPVFVSDVLARPPSRMLRWHYFILYLMLGTHLWLEQFSTAPAGGEAHIKAPR